MSEERKCCGKCRWFDGEMGDGTQFCDALETYVNSDDFCCNHFKEKDSEV